MAKLFDSVSVDELLKLSQFGKVLNNLAESSLISHGFSKIPVKLYFDENDQNVACINDIECLINADSPLDQGTGFIKRKRLQVGKLTHEVFGHGLFSDFDTMNKLFDAESFEGFSKYFDGCENISRIKTYCTEYLDIFKNIFMQISNIVEDPAVEHLALKEYPGLKGYLDDLLDKLKENMKKNFKIQNNVLDVLNLLLAQARNIDMWKNYTDLYPELDESSSLIATLYDCDTYEDRQYLTAKLFSLFFDYIEQYKPKQMPPVPQPQRSGNGEGNKRNEQAKEKQQSGSDSGGSSNNRNEDSNSDDSKEQQNEGSNNGSSNKDNSDNKQKDQDGSTDGDDSSDETNSENKNDTGSGNENDSERNTDDSQESSGDNSESGKDEKSQENSSADNENCTLDNQDCTLDDPNGTLDKFDKDLLADLNKEVNKSKDAILKDTCKQSPQFEAEQLIRMADKDLNKLSNLTFQLVDVKERSDYESVYNALFSSELKRTAATLAKKFKNSFKQRQKGYTMYNLDEGTDIDIQSYAEGSQKIFSENILPNKKPLCSCAVMIDMSGSMNGSKIIAAVRAAIMLEYFCRTLKIPFMAYGHNYNYRTSIYKFLEFNEKKTNKSASKLVAGLASDGRNHDGVALRYGLSSLSVNDGKKKLFFILSDGLPSAPGYHHNDMLEEMPKIKKLAKKNNIIVIPIALDFNSLCSLKSIYDKVVNGTDLSELPNEIIRLTEKEIKKLL